MKLIYDTAMALVGTPYKYGGRHPKDGIDCSELVQILLHVGGADLPGDQSAQDLYNFFSQPANHVSQEPQLGALIAYGSGKSCSHIAMALDRRRMIEAAGGSKDTLTLEIAIKRNAWVKVTPIRFKEIIGIYLPEYPLAIIE